MCRADNVAKAKAQSEILKDSDFPETVKNQAFLGTVLGVDSETIVHSMAQSLSQIETKKAEKENPEKPLAKGYTATEKRISRNADREHGSKHLG